VNIRRSSQDEENKRKAKCVCAGLLSKAKVPFSEGGNRKTVFLEQG
jgi:hypothetical protein